MAEGWKVFPIPEGKPFRRRVLIRRNVIIKIRKEDEVHHNEGTGTDGVGFSIHGETTFGVVNANGDFPICVLSKTAADGVAKGKEGGGEIIEILETVPQRDEGNFREIKAGCRRSCRHG